MRGTKRKSDVVIDLNPAASKVLRKLSQEGVTKSTLSLFSELPVEIQVAIMQVAPASVIAAFEMSGRRWKQFIIDTEIWMYQVLKDYPGIFGTSDPAVARRFMTDMSSIPYLKFRVFLGIIWETDEYNDDEEERLFRTFKLIYEYYTKTNGNIMQFGHLSPPGALIEVIDPIEEDDDPFFIDYQEKIEQFEQKLAELHPDAPRDIGPNGRGKNGEYWILPKDDKMKGLGFIGIKYHYSGDRFERDGIPKEYVGVFQFEFDSDVVISPSELTFIRVEEYKFRKWESVPLKKGNWVRVIPGFVCYTITTGVFIFRRIEPAGLLVSCQICGQVAKYSCEYCPETSYCGKNCQKIHWESPGAKMGHKLECRWE